jgi:hypothetical protein
MKPTSAARWELRAAAAGGRRRLPAISAAVEKREDQRKPEAFFGHRKAARSDNPEVVGSNPSPATISGGCNGFQLHPPVFYLEESDAL